MDIRITPAKLKGSIEAIPSKSDAHRLLICAALCDTPTKIEIASGLSKDILATIDCLESLGASITEMSDGLYILPIADPPESVCIDANESGSTLRFMLPLAAAMCENVRAVGRGRLSERPMSELLRAMKSLGVKVISDTLPIETEGRMQPGSCELPGNVSSQYISGMLFALAYMGGGSVNVGMPVESAGYVDMTLSALSRFGVGVMRRGGSYEIIQKTRFKSPGTIAVEGDWSSAAFWLAAGVDVRGVPEDSLQPDAAILRLLPLIGTGEDIDVSGRPDLAPVLAVKAALTEGYTRLTGAARLRMKESDRLAALAEGIRALGGKAADGEDTLEIWGGKLVGGRVSAYNDHRMAFAWAIAGSQAEGPVVIEGAEAVSKSYPAFFDDFRKLGGRADVL